MTRSRRRGHRLSLSVTATTANDFLLTYVRNAIAHEKSRYIRNVKAQKDETPLARRPYGVRNMEPLDPWGIASTNLRAIGCKVSSRRRTSSTLSVCWRRKLIRTSVQLLAEEVAKLFAHGEAERAQPWRAFVRHFIDEVIEQKTLFVAARHETDMPKWHGYSADEWTWPQGPLK